MLFSNRYQDATRAASYAKLEFANTYHLAFRDLPTIFSDHVSGRTAVDFGCGTGRSTRFLQRLGFSVIGIDIAPEMIAKARESDPSGDYRLIVNDDFAGLPAASADLVLSAFIFDNIPTHEAKVQLFRGLARLLAPAGRIVNIVSTPEIYLHEWASFSTREFIEENRRARSGEIVRIITTDFPDRRPMEDILCSDEAYREIYAAAGLTVAAVFHPLATGSESYKWISETTIAPWAIYVLAATC